MGGRLKTGAPPYNAATGYTLAPAGVGAAETCRFTLHPGERPYLITVLGPTVALGTAGSLTFNGVVYTILPGTSLTLDRNAWPDDCEDYNYQREFIFTGGLGPLLMIWGPVDRRSNKARSAGDGNYQR